MPWWRHIQNITRFRNIKLDTLRDVKTTGKYWLNFVFLTLRVKTKRQVLLRDTVHQTSIGDSPLDMWWTVLRNNKILSLYWNILWYVTKCTQSFAVFYFGDCIVRFQLIQIIFLHIFFMVASRAQSRATMPLSQCQWLKVTHNTLTHWSRVTHICVGKLHVFIIGSDNGLSPDRRQAIIWTNVGLLSIGPLRTYFSENLIKMQQFSLKKMHVKMSSAKWRLSCRSHNVTSVISPNVITLFSATNISNNVMLLLQLHDTIQMKSKSNYTWINYNHENVVIRSHIILCNCVQNLFLLPNSVAFISQKEKRLVFQLSFINLLCAKDGTHVLDAKQISVCCI